MQYIMPSYIQRVRNYCLGCGREGVGYLYLECDGMFLHSSFLLKDWRRFRFASSCAVTPVFYLNVGSCDCKERIFSFRCAYLWRGGKVQMLILSIFFVQIWGHAWKAVGNRSSRLEQTQKLSNNKVHWNHPWKVNLCSIRKSDHTVTWPTGNSILITF